MCSLIVYSYNMNDRLVLWQADPSFRTCEHTICKQIDVHTNPATSTVVYGLMVVITGSMTYINYYLYRFYAFIFISLSKVCNK